MGGSRGKGRGDRAGRARGGRAGAPPRRTRTVLVLDPPEGEARVFASEGALLRFAASEARRIFPDAPEPLVRGRARPRSLWALPSKAALEAWLLTPKSVRHLDRGEAVLIGKVRRAIEQA